MSVSGDSRHRSGRRTNSVSTEQSRRNGVSRLAAGVAFPVAAPSQAAMRRCIDAQTCPFCAAGPFKMLPVHTVKAHGVDKWQLRDLAGLTTTEPLCSPEAIAAMRRAIDPDRNAESRRLAVLASRRNRSPQRWTAAGRAKNAAALAEWVRDNPTESLTARRRAGSLAGAARAVSPRRFKTT